MASIFLTENNPLTISNNNVTAFGNTGTEVVKIAKGNTGIVLDSNVERIELSGVITDYKFKQLGNKLAIYDANDALVVKTGLKDNYWTTQLTFDDGTTAAKLVPNTNGFSLTVSNQTISNNFTEIKQITLYSAMQNVRSGNKIFLENNDVVFHVNDSNAQIFGARGEQAVVIGTNGKNVTTDQNVDRVQFSDSYKNYQFKQVGLDLKVYDLKNELVASVSMQDDENGTQLNFAEGTVNLLISISPTFMPTLNLGGIYSDYANYVVSGGVTVSTTAQKITIPEASFDTSLRSEPMIDVVGITPANS